MNGHCAKADPPRGWIGMSLCPAYHYNKDSTSLDQNELTLARLLSQKQYSLRTESLRLSRRITCRSREVLLEFCTSGLFHDFCLVFFTCCKEFRYTEQSNFPPVTTRVNGPGYSIYPVLYISYHHGFVRYRSVVAFERVRCFFHALQWRLP